jgi:hypothetical protein
MLADDLSGRKRLKAFNRMLCSLLFIPLSDVFQDGEGGSRARLPGRVERHSRSGPRFPGSWCVTRSFEKLHRCCGTGGAMMFVPAARGNRCSRQAGSHVAVDAVL